VAGRTAILRAERWREDSRFVVVHHARDGAEHPLGLRMDMDKRVFLDHLDDAADAAAIQELAAAVWEALAAGLRAAR
jgi:hypothetical protein